MNRVLIVDDEPEIRLGIRLKVDWESLGLTVIGEASNGTEALEKLARDEADIVITDMNMPVMNGVSFLDACHAERPNLKLIVITGYEDFHYAKAAIRNHVRDYLLKPVSQDELAEALRKVAQELAEERRFRDQQAMVQWRLSQYYREMKEQFLIQTVRGDLERSDIVRDRAKLFQLDTWEESRVRFVTSGLRERICGGDCGKRTPDKLRLPFEMICREFAETYPQPPQVFRDVMYSGLLHYVMPDDKAAVDRFVRELSDCVIRHLSLEPVIGIGEPVTGFNRWKDGYMSALLAWNLSGSGVRCAAKEHPDAQSVLTEDTGKLIRWYLVRGELEAFEQTVYKELTEAFMESQLQFVKVIFQLYLLLDSAAYTAGVPLDSGNQLWIRPDMVLGLDSVEKAGEFLTRLGRTIYHMSKANSDSSDSSTIQAARQFINDNYMLDLNLTMLAEKFNYNPSYFSELFKAKVGKTFMQYLTEVRMGQAVSLLEGTDLGLSDIAEWTGFSNASYFSSKFKRMYGMTPSDFRRKPPEKFASEPPKK